MPPEGSSSPASYVRCQFYVISRFFEFLKDPFEDTTDYTPISIHSSVSLVVSFLIYGHVCASLLIV